MQGLQAKQLEAKRIRENFQQLSNESFLEIPDRVQNIHDLQFDDGEDIFAMQVRTIQDAATSDCVLAVRRFLDPEEINKCDGYGNSGVHSAVKAGAVKTLAELHQHGADMNIRNNQGWSPAHVAAMVHRPAMLEMLYRMGSNMTSHDATGSTPAHYAAQNNDVDALDMIYHSQEMPYKPDVIDTASTNGMRPSHTAALHDSLEALMYLQRHGVDLNQRDNSGETPAHKAVRNQNTRTIGGLKNMDSVDFKIANNTEDSAANLETDNPRLYNERSETPMVTVRELTKQLKDGTITRDEFRRLKNQAIDRR